MYDILYNLKIQQQHIQKKGKRIPSSGDFQLRDLSSANKTPSCGNFMEKKSITYNNICCSMFCVSSSSSFFILANNFAGEYLNTID